MIRLVSDLHIDVNRDGNFGFRNKQQDALFIAGDIAGSYQKEIKFLNGARTAGIFDRRGRNPAADGEVFSQKCKEQAMKQYLKGMGRK